MATTVETPTAPISVRHLLLPLGTAAVMTAVCLAVGPSSEPGELSPAGFMLTGVIAIFVLVATHCAPLASRGATLSVWALGGPGLALLTPIIGCKLAKDLHVHGSTEALAAMTPALLMLGLLGAAASLHLACIERWRTLGAMGLSGHALATVLLLNPLGILVYAMLCGIQIGNFGR